MLKLIFLAALITSSMHAEAQVNSLVPNLTGDTALVRQILKNHGLDDADMSVTVPDACGTALNERYLYSNPNDSQAIGFDKISDNTPEKIAQKAYNLFLYQYSHDQYEHDQGRWSTTSLLSNAWQIGLQAQSVFQRLALAASLYNLTLDDHYSIVNLRSYLLDVSDDPKPFLDDSVDVNNLHSTRELLSDAGANIAPDYVSQIEDASLARIACAQGQNINTEDCVKALALLKTMTSYKKINGAYIFPDVWYEVLNTEKYKVGFRKLSLKLLERLDGIVSAKDTIWTDLNSSFIESGMTPSEAEDASWKVMVVASNGAGNMWKRVHFFNDLPRWSGPTIVGLNLIGTALSSIDIKKINKGMGLYSLPSGIDGQCFSTKWYHFWTYAYMARRLVQTGIDKDASSFAAFITAKGYQLNRSAQTSDKTEATKTIYENSMTKFLKLSHGDPINKVMRIDLTLAAAGSLYGAEPSSKIHRSYNIREGFDLLNNYAAAQATSFSLASFLNTGARIQEYYIWDKNIGPNNVYNYFLIHGTPK